MRGTQHTSNTAPCAADHISKNNHRFDLTLGGATCLPDRDAVGAPWARYAPPGLSETVALIQWTSLEKVISGDRDSMRWSEIWNREQNRE